MHLSDMVCIFCIGYVIYKLRFIKESRQDYKKTINKNKICLNCIKLVCAICRKRRNEIL